MAQVDSFFTIDQKTWQDKIQNYFVDDAAFRLATLDDLLLSCSCLLRSFIMDNFTGAELPADVAKFTQSFPHELLETRGVEFDQLKPVSYCRNVPLLCAAKRIIDFACEKYPESVEAAILNFRVLHVIQLSYNEKSPSLKQKLFGLINRLFKSFESSYDSSSEDYRAFSTGVLLEFVRVCLFYHETTQAKRLLKRASDTLGFGLEFSGALGKRTRFQQEAIAQLIVRTNRSAEESDAAARQGDEATPDDQNFETTLEQRIDVIMSDASSANDGASTADSSLCQLRPSVTDIGNLREIFDDYGCETERHSCTDTLPTAVQLNDDTLLPRVQFEKQQRGNTGSKADSAETTDDSSLKCIEQALLLAYCDSERRMQAHEDLVVRAQTNAVVELLAAQPRCFATHFETLLIRSRLDAAASSRTFERALSQYEHLASLTFATRSSASAGACRLHTFFWVDVAARWRVEFEYAATLMRMGICQSALDIYTRLESWSDMVTCYRRLGRLNSAQQLIQERVAALESELQQLEAQDRSEDKQVEAVRWKLADLYCALGEVTGTTEHLDQAWSVSRQRHAASQTVLGFIQLANRKIEEALAAFERSLKVRPLHHGTQFAFGCLSLQSAQYAEAIRAFRMCVSIEPEDARSWSNLAAALMRCGERRKALSLLDEAVRHQYDNWRIWENYMLAAVDCGALPDTVRAVHRLVDLRKEERTLDKQLFEVLVDAAIKSEGESYQKYKKQLREMFGRLSSTKAIRAWFFWFSYAQLVHFDYQSTPSNFDNLDRAIEHVQRSLRALLSNDTLRRTEPNENTQQQSAVSNGPWERDPSRRDDVLLVCRTLVQYVEEFTSSAAKLDEGAQKAAAEKYDSHCSAVRMALNNVTAIVDKYKYSLITPKPGEIEGLDEFLRCIAEILPK